MVFENGVRNIQAAAYNGARTVFIKKLLNKEFLIVTSNSDVLKVIFLTFVHDLIFIDTMICIINHISHNFIETIKTHNFWALFGKSGSGRAAGQLAAQVFEDEVLDLEQHSMPKGEVQGLSTQALR